MLGRRSLPITADHMSNRLKAIVLLLAFGSCMLAFDSLLPTKEIDVTVNHLAKPGDVLVYNIPFSGGELDTCPIGKNELRALPPKAEIVVLMTAIFGRCVGVKPIPTDELECRKGLRADQYRKAIALEQQRKIAEAHSMYSAVCNSYDPQNHEEDPCKASLRLYNRIQKAYSLVITALSEYKSRTGKYPDSLSVVLPELPQAMREAAEGFTYCKKENPSDRTGQCSDGGESFADSEISVATGLYKTYIDLEKRPNPSFHQTCAKNRAGSRIQSLG